MTQLYGLLGRKLGHSFSERFFNSRFAAHGTDAVYNNYEIDNIGLLPCLLASKPQLRGLNVTIPYKQTVIPYLDHLSTEAAAIGAVNVIEINRADGQMVLTGHNTDVIGFRETLRPLLTDNIMTAGNALVLGSGGASLAVSAGLRQLGLNPRTVSRTPAGQNLSYKDLTPEIMSSHLVIVNTTPLGMWPDNDTSPDIPYGLISSRHLCYDLVYNPDPTLFMQQAMRQGANVCGGLQMLERQAVESWRIWTTSLL